MIKCYELMLKSNRGKNYSNAVFAVYCRK